MAPEEPTAEYENDERWTERFRGFRDFLDDAFLEHARYVDQEDADQRLRLRVIDAEGIEAFIHLDRINPLEPEYLGQPTPQEDVHSGLYRFRGLIRIDYGDGELFAWAVRYEESGKPVLIPGDIVPPNDDGEILFVPKAGIVTESEDLLEMIEDAVNEGEPVQR